MPAAAQDQLRRCGIGLDEILGAASGDDILIFAVNHQLECLFHRAFVQFRAAQRADRRAVLPYEYLRSDSRGRAASAAYQACQRNRVTACICVLDLFREVQVLARLVNRIDKEEHRAAANQPVLCGKVFVKLVLSVLRRAPTPQQFAGRIPDVSLHAASAQRTHAAAVGPHQQFRPRLLRSRTLRANHRSNDYGRFALKLLDRFIEDHLHYAPPFDCTPPLGDFQLQIINSCCLMQLEIE